MAATPAFASTPRLGAALVTTANTNRDGTGTVSDLLTGVAAGTRVDRIVAQAAGTGAAPPNPADSILTIFVFSGATYFLYDEWDLGDPAVASVTVTGWRAEKTYSDLILPLNAKIAAGLTVAMTAGTGINVFAHGADLT